MVSTALITSGLLSLMQIKRLSLRWGGLHIGSGLISLSGPSFTFLPIAEAAIRAMRADGTTCPPPLDGGLPAPCPDAFGRYLGTVAVCCLLEVGLSFLPARATRKVFPPLVTGVTVFLIGASLVGTGLKYWGGGSGPCYAYRLAGGGVPIFAECPNTLVSQTSLPWGHANWIGLGFSVFGAILLIEVFGSPFMRSAQIILALLIGFAVAAATGYVGTASITSAPVVTFLWTRTFNLGFYAYVWGRGAGRGCGGSARGSTPVPYGTRRDARRGLVSTLPDVRRRGASRSALTLDALALWLPPPTRLLRRAFVRRVSAHAGVGCARHTGRR